MTRAAAVAFGIALVNVLPAAAADIDPLEKYDGEIVFDVIRKGEKVGQHTVTFRRDGEDIVAESRFGIEIKILSLPVYEYLYTSTGRWRDGALVSLNARTNDDGDIREVRVKRDGDALLLESGKHRDRTVVGTYPTTHWNPGVIGASKVINTITGKINDVRMENLGSESVETAGEPRKATHYAYRGDLTTDVWYDADGNWVKMQFEGSDGSAIEYRCLSCGRTASEHTGDNAGPELAGRGQP